MLPVLTHFNRVRNIPYKIIEGDYNLPFCYRLIEENNASCTPKHLVLADLLKNEGITSRLVVHLFKWKDLKLPFSGKLNSVIEKYPFDFHTNLEALIENRWILLDATWDHPLLEAGLPGTRVWDGKEPTHNNVISLKEWRFNTPDDRNAWISGQKEIPKPDLASGKVLTKELNSCFEQIRMEGRKTQQTKA